MKKLILLLLLPVFAQAQIYDTGTLQRNRSDSTVRGNFGSRGLMMIPTVSTLGTNGQILVFNSATNKYVPTAYTPVPVGLSDSLAKKANRTFDNVASGAIVKSKVDTSSIGLLPKSNLFPLGDTRYAKGVGNAVLTTGNQTVAGEKTYSDIINANVSNNNKIRLQNSGVTQGFLGSDASNFFRVGNTIGGNIFSIQISGYPYYSNFTGGGDRILGVDNMGTGNSIAIGSGLSLSGGVISATGGSSGSVTTSGLTAGVISKGTSASNIQNSIMTESGTTITLGTTAGSLRLGTNPSDYATFSYSGGGASIANNWNSTSAFLDILSNGVGMRLYGTGTTNIGYTSDQGYKLAVNGTTSFNGNSTVNGTISASNLSGGTYTPTLTNTSNSTGATANGTFHYLRVGNQVTVYGSMTWNTVSLGSGAIRISLPIASAFTSVQNGWGYGSTTNANSSHHSLYADVASDLIEFNFTANNPTLICQSYFSFSYTIL